jgi:glycosyltransferase involved in cell wall biosynthesis
MATPVLQVRPHPGCAAAVLAFKEFNQTLGLENSLPGELRRILYNQEMRADLRKRFENDPPDVIFERASLYSVAGVSLARELELPLIVELNAPLAVEQEAYRATGFGNLAAQAERWVLTQADAVIVVSAELRAHAVGLGTAPERVHVLPNGVNASLFHQAERDQQVRARWQLDGSPVIGFVGGLRPWHGVEALPVLLEKLNERFPGVRLVVVGDGPLRGELEQGLDQRGLRSQTVLIGQVPHEEVATVIRQFDVAIAPYARPAHPFYFSPLKLFEYMACGIPVVAPELGQIAEIIQHGQSGLLYPPGDIGALSTQCEQLLGDRALRVRIGNQAAREIQERFTWDHNAARVTELAGNLLKARSS